MKKSTLALTLAALFALPAFAQSPGASEDRAQSSKPATAAEKVKAKSARKAEGTAAARSATTADADPSGMGKAKSTTAAQRKAAAAKRKSEGSKATQEPKQPG